MKVLLIVLMTFLTACAAAEPKVQQEQTDQKESQTIAKTQGEEKTKCLICDFDFEKYKGDLKKGEIEGLLLALNDEYMATATYQKINKKFDDPRPFVNIVKAEMRHSAKLKDLFEKYQVAFPEENPWIGKTPDYDSVKEACKAGIAAEEENVALYDRLFKSTEREDILGIYKNLRRASLENHKPAFERCSSGRGNGKGMGRGMGKGKGRGDK